MASASRVCCAHAYGYGFGSEYEYEISTRMFAFVAHVIIICVASAKRYGRLAFLLASCIIRCVSDFLTSKDVADMLKVSEATLSRWRAAEPLQGPPFVKIEGSIRYPREAMQKWLDDRTLGGALPV